MPAELDRCVEKVQAQGKTKSEAFAICNEQLKESSVELIEQDDDLYLKTFLLDSSQNQNNWGVVPETLDNNIRSFIGKPYVVQEDFGHPESNDTYDHHLQFQERFSIGRIQDITNKDGIYSALIKVTDHDARDAIRQGNFPLYVSPQLWHEEEGQVPQDQMRRWKATHIAAVKEPAFGIKKARVTHQCNGEAGICLAQLKAAKCNFCIKKTIENYKEAKRIEENIDDYFSENVGLDVHGIDTSGYAKKLYSIVTKNANQDYSSLRNKKNNNNSKLSEVKEQEVKTYSEEEYSKLKTANEELENKVKSLEQTNSQLSEENKTVSASLDSLKGEYRKDKVSSILSGVFYKSDDDRSKAIESFTKSGMTYEEIDLHVAPLRSIKSASVESKLQQKSASTEEQEIPSWVTLGGLQ